MQAKPAQKLRDYFLNLELNFAGNNNASGTMIDDKSKQWFGASVHSSGQDGIIVVNLNFSYLENNTPFGRPAVLQLSPQKGNFTGGDILLQDEWGFSY